jgi:hypothetical protein
VGDDFMKSIKSIWIPLRGAVARSQQEVRQLSSRISVMKTGFNYIFHGGSLVTAAAAASSSQNQNISVRHPMMLTTILAADLPASLPGSSCPAPHPSFFRLFLVLHVEPTMAPARQTCDKG